MPRAGFYAIHNSEIRFGRDGRWYADGRPIENPRIADLFSQHVQRRPDGGYMLRIADEQAPIVVEDTPYVVTGVDIDSAGVVWIELSDRSRERLDPHSLVVGADDVLYCRVKDAAEPARFLRAAYYQIAPHIRATAPGAFAIRLPSGDYPIGRR
jgi:uncharacterized protein